MSTSPTKSGKPADGRRLRTERTRQRLVEAYLGLAFEHAPRMPTSVEIAERAGCSVRSVFERFPDLNKLQIAAVIHALDRVIALVPPPQLDANQSTRIEDYVTMRAQFCEIWSRFWRGILANRAESDDLKQKISRFQETRISRLEVIFGQELATLPDAERRKVLLTLGILTDASSWNSMREFLGLSIDEARAVWVDAIQRLLPKAPPA